MDAEYVYSFLYINTSSTYRYSVPYIMYFYKETNMKYVSYRLREINDLDFLYGCMAIGHRYKKKIVLAFPNNGLVKITNSFIQHSYSTYWKALIKNKHYSCDTVPSEDSHHLTEQSAWKGSFFGAAVATVARTSSPRSSIFQCGFLLTAL
jgi:hypothetical protein